VVENAGAEVRGTRGAKGLEKNRLGWRVCGGTGHRPTLSTLHYWPARSLKIATTRPLVLDTV
jgi:hypothetical protein